MPLLALAYGLLLFVLWKNRWYPGLALAFVGIAANALVILVNGGRMPVWVPAYEVVGDPGADRLGRCTSSSRPSVGAGLPARPRPARRHHPDPVLAGAERRVASATCS